MTQVIEKKTLGKRECARIYKEADAAGSAAAEAAVPTPMIVGTPTTPLGNDIDFKKQTYFVSEGVCGFAWVKIFPVTIARSYSSNFPAFLSPASKSIVQSKQNP